MTPMLQTGIGALLLALSYLVILAASTMSFVIIETKTHSDLRKELQEDLMSKSKMIFDEIGHDVSGPVREAILSIDRLERENAALKAAKAVPEPKPSHVPPKKEEPVSDDAED